eukprot:scaffold2280_cov430-Prasinococcus_capsulatus_cf.AAC.1
MACPALMKSAPLIACGRGIVCGEPFRARGLVNGYNVLTESLLLNGRLSEARLSGLVDEDTMENLTAASRGASTNYGAVVHSLLCPEVSAMGCHNEQRCGSSKLPDYLTQADAYMSIMDFSFSGAMSQIFLAAGKSDMIFT